MNSDDFLSGLCTITLFVGVMVIIAVLANWSGRVTCNQRYASFEHDYGFLKVV